MSSHRIIDGPAREKIILGLFQLIVESGHEPVCFTFKIVDPDHPGKEIESDHAINGVSFAEEDTGLLVLSTPTSGDEAPEYSTTIFYSPDGRIGAKGAIVINDVLPNEERRINDVVSTLYAQAGNDGSDTLA